MTENEYKDAIEWLFKQAPNYQIDGKKAYKPGLQNITKLCEFFGNPQDKLKMVHIGGTNGKGSTSNMLASVLIESGYKVGVYNSPHLVDFTERIKINGKNADGTFVFDFIQQLKKLPDDIRPSFFEFTTIMAFEYFAQQNVDIAIIEVGLGGRLDSTNIITPLVTAITNVALDHMNILGNSVAQIAVEKSGIIKPGVPVVYGDSDGEVRRILQEKAIETGSEFIDSSLITKIYSSDLQGDYQAKNIKTVVALTNELKKQGLVITDENISAGLLNVQKNTGFIGRWFQFSDDPLTICDTGHNQAGLELVFRQLNSILKKKHIVLGFVKEKNIDEVLTILPENSVFYFVKPAIHRGRHPEDYENLLKKAGIEYKIFSDVQSGYLAAKQNVSENEMIFIGGSNFVVGDFLEKNLQE